MSAVYGMIDLSRRQVSQDRLTQVKEQMQAPYAKDKIDEYRCAYMDNAVFGYCGQFFTKESKQEVLPRMGETNTSCLTADLVLDNREELMNQLGWAPQDIEKKPDGEIMAGIIEKFGEESLQKFRGTYAYCYYDQQKNEVILAADRVASRVLYYYIKEGTLYFSTRMESIRRAVPEEIKKNEKWCAEYLALDSLTIFIEPERTPYEEIYKLQPGEVVKITKDEVSRKRYWKPRRYEESFQKKTDEEYKKIVRELYQDCVNCRLSSSQNTSILLSGGLDSTSVACIAARTLQQRKENLYSFTSVPLSDYKYSGTTYYKPNEKEYVEMTRKMYPNLTCTYLDLPKLDIWNDTDEMLKVLEIPYKSMQNILWINAAMREAYKSDCRIMLTGQYGNTTISFGNYDINFNTLFWRGKWIRLYQEINDLSKRKHCGRKRIVKNVLGNVKERLQSGKTENKNIFDTVYINPKLVVKYHLQRIFEEGRYNEEGSWGLTLQEYRPFMYFDIPLSQIGEIETKLSLSTGVLSRDPTRDERLIELCMNLPENQFVFQGKERRLVREYLADLMPAVIAKKDDHRGLQSADFLHRLSANWQEVYQKMTELMQTKEAQYYLNLPKYKNKLLDHKVLDEDIEVFEVMQLMNNALLIKYMNQYMKPAET